MKEYPILFSGPMIRAILNGRKTQTRRVMKPQPSDYKVETVAPQALRGEPPKHPRPYFGAYNHGPHWCWWDEYDRQGADWIRCPFGSPGERLWVRETFAKVGDNEDDIHACPDLRKHVYYRTDSVQPEALNWRPSIHMPRWASRVTLEITGIWVERLHDIGDRDARAEGVDRYEKHKDFFVDYEGKNGGSAPTPILSFVSLWNSINAERFPWNSNPWVWIISFVQLIPQQSCPEINGLHLQQKHDTKMVKKSDGF